MSGNTILLLQSILVFLQVVNAGLTTVTHNLLVTLILGALIGAMQFYVQHVGNQTPPNPPAPPPAAGK